ncbi:MAG: helix-hairpin-helix domain-containing protein [Clostridiales bacterium]|jgi:comEA protein|nr:helix-hairpin-helix domain-containing protein [Clostridiales bacterium]
MGKRELVYQIIIGFLILTIAGMLLFPRPAPEPIVYNAAAADQYLEDEAAYFENPVDTNLENSSTPTDENPKTESNAESPKITATAKPKATAKPNPTAKPKTAAQPTPGKITASEGKININTASESQLTRLPGIGEVTAKKIVEYRDTHGNFNIIQDIMKVSGIGETKFANMKDLIEI